MNCCHHLDGDAKCIEHVPIFTSLSCAEKQEIIEIACSRRFEKGEIIYAAGDKGGTLFVLYTGRAKIFRLSANGKEQVLRLVEPGDFIGELTLFSSMPLTDNAVALEETMMCVLHGEHLKERMGKYPSIAFKVMDELSRRLERAENRIHGISLNSVTKRVAEAILELSGDRAEFRLPMTKGDLASQLGMTQETLSRKLASFQSERLITLQGQNGIVIRDAARLREIEQED